MITNVYDIFCSGRGTHPPRRIGPIKITEFQDADQTFVIDHDAESEKLWNLTTTGTYYMNCPACPLDVREFGHNLAKIIVKLSDTTGVFDIDLALISAALPYSL